MTSPESHPHPRHTKIVATVGPATASPEGIRALIGAGVNVIRLNMAHGDHETHARVAEWVREQRSVRPVGILADLAGPKIRIGDLPEPVELVEGTRVTLAPGQEVEVGEIPTTYPALAEDVHAGDRILLDDGLLEVRVTDTRDRRVHAEVVTGGILRANKGLNLPGVRVSAPALTEKDRADLEFALDLGVEFVGLSFVRRAADVAELRELVGSGDDRPKIVAKIEKDTALEVLEEILEATDAVMVARGDLGVELPFQDVPGAQKHIISRAIFHGRPVITATQMLESMITNPRPTRAEANDVATAVYDSSDAVMLSGETAVGAHPARAVRVMRDIIHAVETSFGTESRPAAARPLERRQIAGGTKTEHAVASAAVDAVRTLDAPAIVTLTRSGFTARLVSSYRPGVPVIAVSQEPSTVQQLSLVWGVRSVKSPPNAGNFEMIDLARQHLLSWDLGQPGDRIIVTAGIAAGRSRATDLLLVAEL